MVGPTPTGYNSERVAVVDVYEKSENNIVEKKKKTASKLVEIKEELEMIKRIYYKYLELKSLSKLESYCLQNEILTKNSIDFSISTLRAILSNPVYAPNDQDILKYFKIKGITIYADGDRAKFNGNYGLMVYGKKNGKKNNDIKDWIVSVGLHKSAIKNGLDWIRVQELLEKNKDKRYRACCKHDFLFSGILRCSKCGSYMRPKIAQGERFYYVCELKEKSRGKRCNSRNITGLTLDKLMIKKLEDIFVPTSNIYKELSNMAIKKDKIDIDLKEEELNKKLKRNTEAIKNLIDKLKYMNIEIIDFINDELKRLKEENTKIKYELSKLQKCKQDKIYYKNKKSQIAAIDIIKNCFRTFESLDIKSKKDILRILIEEMSGSGQNVEVKLLDTKINENDRRLFSDIFEETTAKNYLNVVNRIDKQFR